MTQTKEQLAQEYAEKKIQETIPDEYLHNEQIYDADDIKDAYKQAYSDGYTACEQSMWRSVEEELPEEYENVLVHCSDSDPDISDCIAYRRHGVWYFLDEFYYDCTVSHWMPIPKLPSLPDTNTEKA